MLVPIIIKCTKIKTEDTLTWSQIFGRWSGGNIGELVPYLKKPKKTSKNQPGLRLYNALPRVQHVHADTT